MISRLNVLYVPGFGDEPALGQKAAIKAWYIWGVKPEMVVMGWSNNESWDIKYKRLLDRIDSLLDKGKRVALVGASAGGAAVINAYSERQDKITGCVLIAGKVKSSWGGGASAFSEAVRDSESNIEKLSGTNKRRILSRYSAADEIVPMKDSQIPGAINQELKNFDHFEVIARQLTLGAPTFINFLNKPL